MEKFITSTKQSQAKFALIYSGVVVGQIGQYIALPLFLASFGENAGFYFILTWLAFLFNVVFWSLTLVRIYQGAITKEMKEYTKRRHWIFILLGIFNALNGILIVFASSVKRTPGSLQAILSQSITSFTVILSKLILRKHYNYQQILGVFLNIMGIVVSLIPTINDFNAGEMNFMWPLIFMIAQIPLVVLNILEEKIFEEFHNYDSIFMISWECLYQLISFIILFWVDIIPGFGTSADLNDWGNKFAESLTCLFSPWSTEISKCDYCFLLGAIFATAYCLYYLFGAETMKYASANTTALITSVSTVVVVFFWIAFPTLNAWAEGKTYTSLDIICDVVALPIIFMGAMIYRRAEHKQVQEMVKEHEDKGHDHTLMTKDPYETETSGRY
jgi:drug/metabolite transporter (DMT)-like permease